MHVKGVWDGVWWLATIVMSGDPKVGVCMREMGDGVCVCVCVCVYVCMYVCMYVCVCVCVCV